MSQQIRVWTEYVLTEIYLTTDILEGTNYRAFFHSKEKKKNKKNKKKEFALCVYWSPQVAGNEAWNALSNTQCSSRMPHFQLSIDFRLPHPPKNGYFYKTDHPGNAIYKHKGVAAKRFSFLKNFLLFGSFFLRYSNN